MINVMGIHMLALLTISVRRPKPVPVHSRYADSRAPVFLEKPLKTTGDIVVVNRFRILR
jgi:hypothetical protein